MRYNRGFIPIRTHSVPEASPLTRPLGCRCSHICAAATRQRRHSIPANLDGYSPAHSAAERDWEAKFRALPDPKVLRDNMQRLSARPHHVGSPYDKDNAEWMLAKFKEFGFDAQIETFYVLFPTPKERKLEMLEPTKFVAKLQEPPLAVDPTSSQTAEQLPTYNAYSKDGDVTGPLVYVNYGVREDYEQLERMGVSVKGAIVIARYGGAWRGIKPKVAAEHGAMGCIIYSDPRDDGYFEGQYFPDGPFRPSDGVQRGSVMDTDYPGDPLTPGYGATKDAKRLDITEAKTITTIPVLPVSYGDAQPLLAALDRTGCSRGLARRSAYHLSRWPRPGEGAPGDEVELGHQAHLRRHRQDSRQRHARRVGDSRQPSRRLGERRRRSDLRHDRGAGRSARAGRAAEAGMEAEAHHHLLRVGRRRARPARLHRVGRGARRRAEPACRASTSTPTRTRAAFCSPRARTRWSPWSTPSRATCSIPRPSSRVQRRAQLRRIASAQKPDDREAARGTDLRIGALGDGSDYAPFLDHAGVAALNIGFGGESQGGIYHSIYDDFYWYTHFGDPEFVYERALSQLGGTMVMRMADADLLPFDPSASADTVKRYVGELKTELKDKQDKTREEEPPDRRRRVHRRPPIRRRSTCRRRKSRCRPSSTSRRWRTASPPTSARPPRYKSAYGKLAEANPTVWDSPELKAINQQLIQTERTFMTTEGLKERPWFKHQIYAPGAYTGYGVKTIPAVREMMEEDKWADADTGSVIAGGVLMKQAALVDSIAAELEKVVGQAPPATKTAKKHGRAEEGQASGR